MTEQFSKSQFAVVAVTAVVAILFLASSLYILLTLPFYTTSAVLMGIGLCLIVTEAFVPSFGVIGLGGLLSYITGMVLISNADTGANDIAPAWLIAGIGVLGVLLIGLIVYLTLKVYHQETVTGAEGMVGKRAKIVEWDGHKGRVRFMGETWRAYSDERIKAGKGDTLIIASVNTSELAVKVIVD